jgi:hypothetical protein
MEMESEFQEVTIPADLTLVRSEEFNQVRECKEMQPDSAGLSNLKSGLHATGCIRPPPGLESSSSFSGRPCRTA